MSHFEDLFSDFVVSEFSDKYCFRWTGLDDEDPKDVWDQQKTLLTVNEARKARGWDELKDDWGNAPLNPALMGAYQASQQAAQEDYGQPGATPPGGDDEDASGPPGAPGDDQESQDDGQAPPGGDNSDDNGPDMQKSFGLGTPVWRLDP